MRPVSLIIAAMLGASCASTATHERACSTFAGVKFVDLARNRFDEGDCRPLPALEPDFFRRVIDAAGKIPERPALTSAVNSYLNDRLGDLTSGRYNTIYVALDDTRSIGITPAVHGARRDVIMLWIVDRLNGRDSQVLIFDAAGKLLAMRPEQFGLRDLPKADETFESSMSSSPEKQRCAMTLNAGGML